MEKPLQIALNDSTDHSDVQSLENNTVGVQQSPIINHKTSTPMYLRSYSQKWDIHFPLLILRHTEQREHQNKLKSK